MDPTWSYQSQFMFLMVCLQETFIQLLLDGDAHNHYNKHIKLKVLIKTLNAFKYTWTIAIIIENVQPTYEDS